MELSIEGVKQQFYEIFYGSRNETSSSDETKDGVNEERIEDLYEEGISGGFS